MKQLLEHNAVIWNNYTKQLFEHNVKQLFEHNAVIWNNYSNIMQLYETIIRT